MSETIINQKTELEVLLENLRLFPKESDINKMMYRRLQAILDPRYGMTDYSLIDVHKFSDFWNFCYKTVVVDGNKGTYIMGPDAPPITIERSP